MAFTYLKVKSAKCLCLLPMVLVLVLRIWSCVTAYSAVRFVQIAAVNVRICLVLHHSVRPSVCPLCTARSHHVLRYAILGEIKS